MQAPSRPARGPFYRADANRDVARAGLPPVVFAVARTLHVPAGGGRCIQPLSPASTDYEVSRDDIRGNATHSSRRLLQVAFTRWNVEHVFRVAKSEVGLMHFEGRSYVSLKRHLALCLVALAFVALHTMQLRRGNPEVTLEQVCRALKRTCRQYLSRNRGTSETSCLSDILQYHQHRNAAARRSRLKRPRRLRRFATL